jgi:hypothetical protein
MNLARSTFNLNQSFIASVLHVKVVPAAVATLDLFR